MYKKDFDAIRWQKGMECDFVDVYAQSWDIFTAFRNHKPIQGVDFEKNTLLVDGNTIPLDRIIKVYDKEGKVIACM